MNTKTKIALAAGIATVFALALVVGGWFAYAAYAQSTNRTPDGLNGGCHNNQAVLALLKISESDLKSQREAGKSLLDIASAKAVSEQQLTDALIQPITAMHGWMAQNYPQSNAEQMTQYMRDWIAKDIRQTQYGTMTDFRLFGGNGAGMMGGANGMINGVNEYGGMMGGGNGYGGMMNGNGGMMTGRSTQ
jgi:hypothetical protein